MLGENSPVITSTQKDFSISFTEWSATPSRNPSPRQLIILQRFFLALNLCKNLLLRQRMWLEWIALGKFLIRIRILNQTQSHALILIHTMNLTLGLSILRKKLPSQPLKETSLEIPKDQIILGRLLHRSQIQMYIQNIPTQQQRNVP